MRGLQSADAAAATADSAHCDPPVASCPPIGSALAPHLPGLAACDGPVVACDLAGAQRCLADWSARFPGVHASTSAQALGSRPLTHLLALSGLVSFRAYSKSDLDAASAAGVPGHAVLLANPCKTRGLIGHARHLGVGVTVFDSDAELLRLAAAWPEVELLLLVRPPAGTDTGRRTCRHRLGAELPDCPRLLAAARDLGLRVAGLAVWLGDDDDDDDNEEDGAEVAADEYWSAAAASARDLLAVARDIGHEGADAVDLGCLTPETLARRALPAFSGHGRLLCDLTPTLLSEAVVMATRVMDKAIEWPGCYSYRLSGGLAAGGQLCGLIGEGGGGVVGCGGELRVPSRLVDGGDPLMLPELRIGDWLLWRGLRACPTAARLLHCLRPGEIFDCLEEAVPCCVGAP